MIGSYNQLEKTLTMFHILELKSKGKRPIHTLLYNSKVNKQVNITVQLKFTMTCQKECIFLFLFYDKEPLQGMGQWDHPAGQTSYAYTPPLS